MTRARILSVCLFCSSAWAQIYPGGGYPGGGYPGGGYPGGGYPGGGSPGQRPIPGTNAPNSRQGRNAPQTKQSDVPMPNFRGTLARMDAKNITLSTEDHREIDFKRTDKTKFLKDGKDAKPEDFKPGDEISVEGPLDAAGNLTAVNVHWEKAAPSASATETSAREDKTPDTWASKTAAPEPEPVARPTTQLKPPPAAPDSDDPGPPALRRGKPADSPRAESKPPAEMAQPAPAVEKAAGMPVLIRKPDNPDSVERPPAPRPRAVPRGDEDLPFGSVQRDPIIRKATDAAFDFSEGLPDYVCQELIARFQSDTRPARWQPIDVVGAEVVYQSGKEEYRNITIDGKPTRKPMEESGGAWSTGEFATVLLSLFSPATAAKFHFVSDSRISGISAKQYSFEVARENSNWTIRMASQTYRPAYSGAVWIDPATYRVLRIEMEAKGFPGDFPADHVESATDYSYVRLGDARQFLLPVHSEMLSCERGTNNCSLNKIDFRNYHKFEGQSTITFGAPKQ